MLAQTRPPSHQQVLPKREQRYAKAGAQTPPMTTHLVNDLAGAHQQALPKRAQLLPHLLQVLLVEQAVCVVCHVAASGRTLRQTRRAVSQGGVAGGAVS